MWLKQNRPQVVWEPSSFQENHAVAVQLMVELSVWFWLDGLGSYRTILRVPIPAVQWPHICLRGISTLSYFHQVWAIRPMLDLMPAQHTFMSTGMDFFKEFRRKNCLFVRWLNPVKTPHIFSAWISLPLCAWHCWSVLLHKPYAPRQ